MVKVGDALPTATLFVIGESGPEPTSLPKLFEGKRKGVVFGVPGAFTPGCTKTHLPGYVADYEKLKAAGAEVVVALTVNDPFVAKAWEDAAGAGGKVIVAADPLGAAAKELDLEWDALLGIAGNLRLRRFSAVIVDGKFATLNVEESGGGLTCSLSNEILKQLAAV